MEFTASLTIACSPNNVTSGQVRDIIIKALRNHPEDRQTDAYILVVAALVEAMPCGQAKVSGCARPHFLTKLADLRHRLRWETSFSGAWSSRALQDRVSRTNTRNSWRGSSRDHSRHRGRQNHQSLYQSDGPRNDRGRNRGGPSRTRGQRNRGGPSQTRDLEAAAHRKAA